MTLLGVCEQDVERRIEELFEEQEILDFSVLDMDTAIDSLQNQIRQIRKEQQRKRSKSRNYQRRVDRLQAAFDKGRFEVHDS